MAEQNPSAGEITENQPLHGNGDAAAHASTEEMETGEKKSYRTEEFVRVRRQIGERLDRVRDELSKVDAEDLGRKVGDWVRDNPWLSVTLVAGTGLLIGRGLVSLLSEPEPPPLSQRARQRVRRIAHSAQGHFEDLGEAVADRASDAGAYIIKKAGEAKEDLSRKAAEFSDEVTRKAADVAGAISESAERAARDTRESTYQAAKSVRARSAQSRDFAESLLGSIKTAVAAAVVRRISEWTKR